MARFEKTRLHVVSAVLILLGLYAVGGLAHALWTHSDESVTFWAVVAVFGFLAAAGFQTVMAKKRRPTP